MILDTNNPGEQLQGEPAPAADYGNASNPSPHTSLEDGQSNQLLDKRAEKYLREVASIEDLPDAQDQEEMDETIKEANKQKEDNP